jgi:type VI secretion system protein ImpK
MQSVTAEKLTVEKVRARAENDLVSLSAPVLELIMQVRAGLVQPSKDTRRTFDGLLKQMEQEGEAFGYKDRQAQAAKFALAAFIDETVLTADFPLREEWGKYPLQLEYFGEHLAGVKFFERLDDLLKDAERDADVLEVYYCCLLIGYKGKYKIYLEDQLKVVIQTVADALRRVNRLRAGALSPHWKADDQPELQADPGLPRWVKVGGGVWLGSVILIFLVLVFWLNSSLDAAMQKLLR